jgi:hypothetical protein
MLYDFFNVSVVAAIVGIPVRVRFPGVLLHEDPQPADHLAAPLLPVDSLRHCVRRI